MTGVPSLKERRVRRLGAPDPVSGLRDRAGRARKPGLLQKAGQTGFPIRPDMDHKRDETPRLCVPETSGTGGAPAARQDPCLAKTRRVLPLISRFRCRAGWLGCGELDIMGGLAGGCKGDEGLFAWNPLPFRSSSSGAGDFPTPLPLRHRHPCGVVGILDAVIPAQAGTFRHWVPAFAGMTFHQPCACAHGVSGHLMIFATTPAPTVRPPSRIAKRRPSSIAIGLISAATVFTLSPGITISVPSGSVTAPVMSVVRK